METSTLMLVIQQGVLTSSCITEQYLQGLFRLVVLEIEPVGRKLLYIGFSESSRFGFAKPFGQVEQCLRRIQSYILKRDMTATKEQISTETLRNTIYDCFGGGGLSFLRSTLPLPHSSPSPHHPHPGPDLWLGPLQLEALEALNCTDTHISSTTFPMKDTQLATGTFQ